MSNCVHCDKGIIRTPGIMGWVCSICLECPTGVALAVKRYGADHVASMLEPKPEQPEPRRSP